MKKGIQQFWRWVRTHPIKATCFSVFLIGGAAWWELNGEPKPGAFFFYNVAMLVLMADAMGRDMKKIAVPLILCAALVVPTPSPANEAQVSPPGYQTVILTDEQWYPGLYPGHPDLNPDSAGVFVGVCVIGGGVVATIFLIKWCKKLYAKTNSEPAEFSLLGIGEDESAASDYWFGDYCIEDPVPDLVGANGLDGTLIDGSARIEDTAFGPVLKTSISIRPPERTCNRDEFMAWLRSKGLPIEAGRHYARNGTPARAEDVPIRFSAERGLVPHVIMHPGQPSITTVTERSFDLVEWTPLVTNTAPPWMQVTFSDRTDSGHAAYRTRLVDAGLPFPPR